MANRFAADGPEWVFRGNDIAHYQSIPAANCRPPKDVVDQTIGPVLSQCKSLSTCPPFIKNYHQWSANGQIFDFVAGIGIGCLLFQGGMNFTRFSSDIPGIAGPAGPISGQDAVDSLNEIATRFNGTYNVATLFGTRSGIDRACPDA